MVSSGELVLNVKDFGAKGDGVTDDTAAIQAAIYALGYAGGVLYFPKGIYLISDTLNVGNGTASAVSTQNAITLQGAGAANTGAAVYDGGFGTMIRYIGSTEKPMIHVRGPINAPRILDISLDGNMMASIGVRATNALGFKYRPCAIRDTTQIGILMDSWPSMTVSGTKNNMSCDIADGWINLGNSPYAVCIKLSGDIDGGDTNMSRLHNLHLLYSGTNGRALLLGFCDSNLFDTINCYRQGADNGSAYSVIFDGTEQVGYPAQNTFINFSATSDDVAVYGTIGDNIFYNYQTGDGGAVPDHPNLRGVTQDGHHFGSFDFANLKSSNDLETTGSGNGLIVKTPDGTKRYRIYVSNAGALSAQLL
ncbi:hypothetical protein DQG13_20040 [Paenibacillus sp. YN15]|nr:hypothetical protein DQG13_20040 [Paenibacillus sp. YN15]